MIFELCILAFFSWALRSIFASGEKIGVLSDTLAHLFMIKTQQGHARFNYAFDKAVRNTELGYPKLQHFLISRFPEETWLFVGRWLIILHDLLSALLLYAVVHVSGFDPLPGALGSAAFWAALLLSTAPILFSVRARLSGLGNARTFSLLQVFALLTGWYIVGLGTWLGIALLTLPAMLVIVWTSFFGLQAAILLSFFVFLLTGYPAPFVCVVGSLGVLYALPVGARQILVHKYQHWVWYFRNIDGGTLPGQRNRLADFAALPRLFLSKRERFQTLVYTRLTPVIFFVANPAAPVILWAWATGRLNDPEPLIGYSLAIFGAGFLAFLLISLRPLSFLGEAERYTEFTAPFQALLIVHLVVDGGLTGPWLPLLLLVQLTLIVGLYRYINRARYRSHATQKLVRPAAREVYRHFLGDKSGELRVLTLPVKAAFFWSYATYDLEKVSFYQSFMGSEGGFAAMEEEMRRDNFNLPALPLDLLRDRYGVNRVLLVKVRPAEDAALRSDYSLTEDKVLLENADYILFSL